MPFDTIFFIFLLLPIVILIHLIAKDEFKSLVLIVASLFFYSFYNINGALQLVIYSSIVYLLSLLIIKSNHNKILLTFSIMLASSYLIYYKYADFILVNVSTIFPSLELEFVPPAAPLGISFFTFTSISYLVDIYREKNQGLSFIEFLNYIAFFPKVISGPIVRTRDFIWHNVDSSSISQGIFRFIIGLGKKTIFAYYFGITVDRIWNQLPTGIDTPTAWIAAICYTLQIYFDFSGYSDMAIGISKMLGYSIPENFNFPYISTSVSEFWRRWHISLGSWFREYVYFPLGGTRKGNAYLNLFIVFLVTGIWHGANWTFIVWGIWHGLLRLIEKASENTKLYKTIPKPIKWLITILTVIVGWVLFRSENIQSAFDFIGIMFGSNKVSNTSLTFTWEYFLNNRVIILGILGIFFSTLLEKSKIVPALEKVDKEGSLQASLLITMGLAALLAISIMMIVSSSHSPFIYFQF